MLPHRRVRAQDVPAGRLAQPLGVPLPRAGADLVHQGQRGERRGGATRSDDNFVADPSLPLSPLPSQVLCKTSNSPQSLDATDSHKISNVNFSNEGDNRAIRCTTDGVNVDLTANSIEELYQVAFIEEVRTREGREERSRRADEGTCAPWKFVVRRRCTSVVANPVRPSSTPFARRRRSATSCSGRTTF